MTAAAQPKELALHQVPDQLRGYHERLGDALRVNYPLAWKPDDDFIKAEQPEAIGKVLVQAIHNHLLNAKILYLFRKEIKGRGRIVLAKASKAAGKLNFLQEWDLCIDVNWTAWAHLYPGQRVALIDHELCHFDRDTDKQGRSVYGLVPHDVEEFTSIVRRWGTWEHGLVVMASALDSAPQLQLFGGHD